MPPHQIPSSDLGKHHSAPTWRPHAAAWGAMDDDEKFEYLEEACDGLDGPGEFAMVDSMVGRDAALPAIINALEKSRAEGGLY